MQQWQLQEAKARLSEVVQRCRCEGPQAITVRGSPAAVVISSEEYERLKSPRLGFVEFLRQSPLVGLDLEFERDRSLPREVDL